MVKKKKGFWKNCKKDKNCYYEVRGSAGTFCYNKPNKSKGFYGNSVAAPVFKKVAQKIITGIPIEIEISKKDIDILFWKS